MPDLITDQVTLQRHLARATLYARENAGAAGTSRTWSSASPIRSASRRSSAPPAPRRTRREKRGQLLPRKTGPPRKSWPATRLLLRNPAAAASRRGWCGRYAYSWCFWAYRRTAGSTCLALIHGTGTRERNLESRRHAISGVCLLFFPAGCFFRRARRFVVRVWGNNPNENLSFLFAWPGPHPRVGSRQGLGAFSPPRAAQCLFGWRRGSRLVCPICAGLVCSVV